VLACIVTWACEDVPAPRDAAHVDGGSDAAAPAFTLPPVLARCDGLADVAHGTLALPDPVPVLALARGERDLGLAYVERVHYPLLARFRLQRVGLDAQPIGAAIELGPIDQSIPGPVSVALDGTDYVACTIAIATTECFRVDPTDAVSDAGIFPDVSGLAIASGAGGLVGAWIEADELHVGSPPTTASVIGAADVAPSIAPTETGYVVGYAAAGTAYVVSLDARAIAGTPIAIGAVHDAARVAVSSAAGVVGASFVAPSGDAIAVVVDGGAIHATPIGAGAMSYGQVAITRTRDGFFATWSDLAGEVRGRFVDRTGTATDAPYAHPVSWDDDAHAVVALADGIALVTNTTPMATPLELAIARCP
jgi:hypothetical protein